MRQTSVIVAVLASVAPAEAKYDGCRSTGIPWLGASGSVPRNFKLWRADRSELSAVALRVRGGGLDRIVPDRGQTRGLPVDLGVLAPRQTYEVTVPAYRDLWLGSFTTSTEVDLAPPRVPVIRALAISHPTDAHHAASDDPVNESSDPPANDFAFDLELSDDTAFLDLEITDETTVHHARLWREDLPLLGRTRCGARFHLAAGDRVCVSIRAIDLAGNVGAPAVRCTSVVERWADSSRQSKPLSNFPWSTRAAPADPLPWWTWFGFLALVASWLAARMAGPRAELTSVNRTVGFKVFR